MSRRYEFSLGRDVDLVRFAQEDQWRVFAKRLYVDPEWNERPVWVQVNTIDEFAAVNLISGIKSAPDPAMRRAFVAAAIARYAP